ncbi:MAG: TIGR03668 family PPOX class F420-dependent oxidoreductase, partial [Chloroflexi bacterium]|nr:TIGR03668 family PPOX class F420-dependent oxidoreductase [Chloroflexota bacterium]
LKRIRNILANENVALVLDRYREQWDRLAYLMVQGTARVIESGPEQERAIALLREKYSQYLAMALESAPVIEITPRRFIQWGAVGVEEAEQP